jgi:uncharacterized protein YegJ (DUF2314 family)
VRRAVVLGMILLSASLSLSIAACAKDGARGDVAWSKTNSPEVVSAMAEARRTLAIFWRRYDAKTPGADQFALKVSFPTRHGGQEYMWVAPTQRTDAEVVGQLIDEPEKVEGLKPGDQVRFDPGRIADWGYERGGKVYGNFTTRILLNNFSPEDRAHAAAHFSPTPLETEDR